jgi:RNA polymerase sigma-70 factor (ECF subfamily)
VVEFSSHIKSATDAELVARFKETGDNICIGELFSRYRHLVFGVCMKYLADEDESQDVQMQVFEKLLRDLARHNVEQFKGWLYTVTKNECLMYIRARKTKRLNDQELKKNMEGLVETDHSTHPEGITDTEHQLREMEDSLEGLGENQRRCLELFYLELKCYKEVADITGFSLNEVKSFIQNGKRNLKILMTKRNHG